MVDSKPLAPMFRAFRGACETSRYEPRKWRQGARGDGSLYPTKGGGSESKAMTCRVRP